ncbi:DUF4856 domain-containing protein [Kordia sp. YSTF-M3]|uniref:DUF4856 domain-containing protein n=1 Tax=Kordia aestuariivivens TaxID=2759037 RepID=A0ABR7Q8H3_9FLAO|nr:DUF4856 domain-containing protein [Kordia aestuariivivens]MBC8754624.1 DUF4856 domain-containing protein [Kordia aestuariivivens]
MKKVILGFLTLSSFIFTACSDDDGNEPIDTSIVAPATYEFSRDGSSSVSYSGQTTRIQMGEEFIAALTDNTRTETALDGMFAHAEGNNDFSNTDLNASDKSIRSKTAASSDYFSANTTDANAIKADFDAWIANQVSDVFPNWATTATAGNAGNLQEAGGGSTRYISGKGLEYNQVISKSLIGALMVDQMLNNYLSPSVLDAGSNIADNDAGIVAEGKSYTNMEHKWDEAFGYLYGTDNATNPILNQDSFLNKYLSRVENDADFAGIASEVYEAFKLGRAAIVAKNYEVRDAQANIIREKISTVIGVRAVYYLQSGKNVLATDKAAAFHDLSEGFGFIYSLQFTRKPGTNEPYFTKTEVDGFINQLMTGNGFWDVSPATLDEISEAISSEFSFTTAQASN